MKTQKPRKRLFEQPESRVIDLEAFLDVCNNSSLPSSGTDPFIPNPGGGWEDDFNN